MQLKSLSPDSLAHTRECAAAHFGTWMVEERWFRAAVEAVKAGTYKPVAYEDDSRPQEAKGPPYRMVGGIAVIPLCGPLMKARSKFGGTATVDARHLIRKAVRDETVKAILLHIDSPGGTVAGTGDLAADVASANSIKPVHAHIDDLGASAAYWIASQAKSITANPTGEIGSIGTLLVIEDSSGQYEKEGIKVHVVSTGEHKGAGVEGAPITEGQLAQFQTEVDDLNEHFLAAVSTGRKISMDAVRAIADGRVFIAEKAKQLRLIDKVAPLDVTMQAINQEIFYMENPVEAFKAEHPDAFQAIVKQGYDQAKAELTPKPATVAQLREAFPTDADKGFCMDMLGEEATLDQARAKYITKQGGDIKAIQTKCDEYALKLVTANPGSPPVAAPTAQASAPAPEDHPAIAAQEWESKPEVRKGFSSKDNYVAYRASVLDGSHRDYSPAQK